MNLDLTYDTTENIIEAMENAIVIALGNTTDIETAKLCFNKAFENIMNNDTKNMIDYLRGYYVGDEAISTWEETLQLMQERLLSTIERINIEHISQSEHIKINISDKVALANACELFDF